MYTLMLCLSMVAGQCTVQQTFDFPDQSSCHAEKKDHHFDVLHQGFAVCAPKSMQVEVADLKKGFHYETSIEK